MWLGILAGVGCFSPEANRYRQGGYVSTAEVDRSGPQCSRSWLAAPIEQEAGLFARVTGLVAQGRYEVVFPGGRLDVEAEVLGGNPSGAAHAAARVGITPEPSVSPIPGFLFGVDLRSFRSIAIVLDSTFSTCKPLHGAGSQLDLHRLMLDHVIAAIAGVPPETALDLYVSDGNTRHLKPAANADGRLAAMQWTCALVCSWDGSVGESLRQAIGGHPDVVVVVSDGGPAWEPGNGPGDLQTMPDRYRDTALYGDPVAIVEADSTVPIIAIEVDGVTPTQSWMRPLAERTGGRYVPFAVH